MIGKMQHLLFVLFLAMSLLLAACGAGEARLAIEATEFDFGDVTLGDIVTRDLSVSNTGTSVLVIESISTSCGCTTAAIDQTKIPAGANTVLHITFDSAAHGDVTGIYTRQVFLATNNAEQAEIIVQFTANVISGQEN